MGKVFNPGSLPRGRRNIFGYLDENLSAVTRQNSSGAMVGEDKYTLEDVDYSNAA